MRGSVRASAQLSQKNQAEAQQKAQQAQAADPLNIIQRAELDLKGKELAHKIEVDKGEMAISRAKLVLEAKKIESEVDHNDNALAMKSVLDGVKTIRESGKRVQTPDKSQDFAHAAAMKSQDHAAAAATQGREHAHAATTQGREHADALQREKFASRTKVAGQPKNKAPE